MLHYEDYNNYVENLIEEEALSRDNFVDKNKSDQISFTPYIYNTCSANCAFCSEKLVRDGKVMACDDICSDYDIRLQKVFKWLKGKPVFLSISGKEPSESSNQIKQITDAANQFVEEGGLITDRVIYTNLSGFGKKLGELKDIIEQGKITRIECSRHHYDEEINQQIVNFRDNVLVKSNDCFKQTVKVLNQIVPVKMVCVTQKAGISTCDEIIKYLDFAKSAGANSVVFRELAMFDDAVEAGKTTDYIVNNRVELLELLKGLDETTFTNLKVTKGYYYFSFEYNYKDMKVSFEMSDYEQMIKNHYDGSKLNKIILYPNGMVCKDWNMKGQIFLDEE